MKLEPFRFVREGLKNLMSIADPYEIPRHDLPPYEHQNEPRYHTLLAWARKDALMMGWHRKRPVGAGVRRRLRPRICGERTKV
jgi:hypothetical protein